MKIIPVSKVKYRKNLFISAHISHVGPCNILRKEIVFCFPADGCLLVNAEAESGSAFVL